MSAAIVKLQKRISELESMPRAGQAGPRGPAGLPGDKGDTGATTAGTITIQIYRNGKLSQTIPDVASGSSVRVKITPTEKK